MFSGNALVGITFKMPDDISPVSSKTSAKAAVLLKKQLTDYFNCCLEKFNQDIVFLHGTDFEHKVWLCLKDIPYGETRTYKWVAERVGRPKAVRAVGQALSKNPVPIVLPCHRVIMSDGSLGGYSPGIENLSGADIKRRLLEMEYYANLSNTKKEF